MKKKLVSVLLCVAMVASMAVGCGSKSDSKSKESGFRWENNSYILVSRRMSLG